MRPDASPMYVSLPATFSAPERVVERFSFAADDGRRVVATTCLKCGALIRNVSVESLGIQPYGGRGRAAGWSGPTQFRVTLSCHGETEVAPRQVIELEAWVADAHGWRP